jgi:hypothetical protein
MGGLVFGKCCDGLRRNRGLRLSLADDEEERLADAPEHDDVWGARAEEVVVWPDEAPAEAGPARREPRAGRLGWRPARADQGLAADLERIKWLLWHGNQHGAGEVQLKVFQVVGRFSSLLTVSRLIFEGWTGAIGIPLYL